MVGAAPTTFKVSIAVGASGAQTEITTYLDAEATAEYAWGLDDPAGAVKPGTFAFTLVNNDGRFTPENPALTAYPLTLAEGMTVVWELNGRIVTTSILSIEPFFIDDLTTRARVRVTCDDLFGDLSRNVIRSLRAKKIDHDALYNWPLNSATQVTTVVETSTKSADTPPMLIAGDPQGVKFGVESVGGAWSFDSGADFNAGTDTSAPRAYALVNGAITAGAPGVIVDYIPSREATNTPRLINFGGTIYVRIGRRSTGVPDRLWVNGVSYDLTNDPGIQQGMAYRYLLTRTGPFIAGTRVFTLYRYGPEYGTVYSVATGNITFPIAGATSDNRFMQDGTPGVLERVADVFSTQDAVELYTPVTPDTRMSSILELASGVTLATEGTFSGRLVGAQPGQTSFLDALADAAKVEQGRIWVGDSGSLLAPNPFVNARSQDKSRQTAVTLTLDAITDLDGAPELTRELTNLVTLVHASSATADLEVLDSVLAAAKGEITGDFEAPAYDASALRNLAEDLIRRGALAGTRVTEVKIDLRSTSTNRWAAYLALKPGDRIQISSLSLPQLGATTWEGWFIGAKEEHSESHNWITLYLEAPMPVFVFDTARFAGGSALTLAADITSSATSFTVNSSGVLFTTSGGEFSQKIRIGNEVMTVAGVSGASSPQTFTISARGTTNSDGAATAAVAHSAGAGVDVYPFPVFSL